MYVKSCSLVHFGWKVDHFDCPSTTRFWVMQTAWLCTALLGVIIHIIMSPSCHTDAGCSEQLNVFVNVGGRAFPVAVAKV